MRAQRPARNGASTAASQSISTPNSRTIASASARASVKPTLGRDRPKEIIRCSTASVSDSGSSQLTSPTSKILCGSGWWRLWRKTCSRPREQTGPQTRLLPGDRVLDPDGPRVDVQAEEQGRSPHRWMRTRVMTSWKPRPQSVSLTCPVRSSSGRDRPTVRAGSSDGVIRWYPIGDREVLHEIALVQDIVAIGRHLDFDEIAVDCPPTPCRIRPSNSTASAAIEGKPISWRQRRRESSPLRAEIGCAGSRRDAPPGSSVTGPFDRDRTRRSPPADSPSVR